MTNAQDTQFAGFAGQLVASGVGQNSPLVGLEQSVTKETFANLATIHGLMAKIKDVFIRETKIFENPLEPYIIRYDERYGAGLEQAAFMVGARNEKRDGTCVPRGSPDVASQIDLVNFSYSIDVDVKDREVDKAVLDEGQAGAYVAQKMRTPLKTLGILKYRAWIQVLSDVIDGTRSIDSTTDYNGYAASGTAAAVTYNPTITGYAGRVTKRTEVLPKVEVGTKFTISTPRAALDIANDLRAAAADFRYESVENNKLGIMTFTTGTPVLVAERKVLDAMDVVFAEANADGSASGYGYAGFPTVSARDYLRQFCEIVEIDTFASLPTNTAYADYNLHFVLIDRDAFVEVTKYADMEGQRCAKDRLIGYNWQGESIISIWRGANAYALVFPSS